ncbi:docking protein 1b [Paramormyrops kingsleyae]|uniref:Docking protein 1b n=1 Tax=Paramormyrops kingsleyae TaxID=1676925 RepID=A0A3B3QKM7_9TELE|nr:docking protein 1 [Paramormyrops kingsleyae]
MDTHVKEGQLYVQHQKFGKKWKKNWFVLYPASQNGIARLEFFDSSNASEKPNTKKLDKKIIRLAECISILPAVTEACPKDNMAAFCVETNDKTHIFAAEKQTTAEWVEKMCEIAFQRGSGTDTNGQELQMADNLIYYSREEVNEYWVSVQRTEASERCSLQGTYWLKADSESLILKEPNTKKMLLMWPYKLLRRYGRDKVMFSFEAGRRCDSGPGNFTFETKQGNEIFGIVEAAIREQKAQAEERHQSCPSLDLDSGSLQQNRSPNSDSGGDPDGDSGGSKPGSADGVFGKKDAEGKNLKTRMLPEPPPAVSSTPPRSPLARGTRSAPSQEDQSSLYSEPADSVRIPPSSVDYLYSDPVDSIKTPMPVPRQRPQGDEGARNQGNKQEPLYSDIYDRVDLTQRTAALVLDGRTRNGARQVEGAPMEHIYDEPEGRGTPQGATVYDEARIEPLAWRNRGLEDPLFGHEFPYNPTTDDYSVPAYGKQPQLRAKGPKPLPAPKPNKVLVPRKDPPPLPQGKIGANLNNNNSGNGANHTDVYSQISRRKSPSSAWHSGLSCSPDVIYDNLGNI